MNWMPLALVLACLLSLVALVVSVLALSVSRDRVRRVKQSQKRLESELALANSAAIGMGNRLLNMEKRLQQGGSGAGADVEDLPYTQASQLFAMGLSVEEVGQRCGLSRAEASLLQAMQENKNALK